MNALYLLRQTCAGQPTASNGRTPLQCPWGHRVTGQQCSGFWLCPAIPRGSCLKQHESGSQRSSGISTLGLFAYILPSQGRSRGEVTQQVACEPEWDEGCSLADCRQNQGLSWMPSHSRCHQNIQEHPALPEWLCSLWAGTVH